MTELECAGLYETGEPCGICATCLLMQARDLAERALYGSPSDIGHQEAGA